MTRNILEKIIDGFEYEIHKKFEEWKQNAQKFSLKQQLRTIFVFIFSCSLF